MEKEKEDIKSTELITESIKEFEPFNEPLEIESDKESESESESESNEETKSIKKPKSLEDMDKKDKKYKRFMIDGKLVENRNGVLCFHNSDCITYVYGVEYKRTTRKY